MNPLVFPPEVREPVLNARHYRLLALGFLALNVYGSLIPFDFTPLAPDRAWLRFHELVLFTPSDVALRGDWVVSVFQYGVMSFCLMGAWAVDRPARFGHQVAFLAFAACALVGLVVEFLQVYFPTRTVSWNDLAVEALGSLAGVLTWLAFGQRCTAWARRLDVVRGLSGLATQALPAYLVVLLVVQLMPFDFVIRGGELARKFEEGRVKLSPIPDLSQGKIHAAVKVGANVACFLPLGFLPALAWGRSPTSWPRGMRPLALGLLGTGQIELLQLLAFSRIFDLSDVVTGTLAVAAGWGLGRALAGAWDPARAGDLLGPELGPYDRPRVGRNALLLAGAGVWLAVVVLVEWRPWDFTTDPRAFVGDAEDLELRGLRRMSLLPIVDYYFGSKYNALDQFVKKMVAFAPLGLVAGLLALRQHGAPVAWAAAGVAFVTAVAVEAGQYFLPTHYPSVTDPLLAALGAGGGYAACRYVRAALGAGEAPRATPAVAPH